MDKTELTSEVAELFRMNGYRVTTSVRIGNTEIDVVAEERQGLIRKTILIECADYASTVGVEKMRSDKDKLQSVRETNPGKYVLAHVSRNGYSPDAAGIALEKGIDIYTPGELRAHLINFDEYVAAIKKDKLAAAIKREYQESRAYFAHDPNTIKPATTLISNWIRSSGKCLLILGDYGVGKSWLMRKVLYDMIEAYESDTISSPMPFFVPLQKFPKAFDLKNLITRTLDDYGLSGVHYDAFRFLLNKGKIVLLLDSFDEMAQHLGRGAIKSNLMEILSVCERDAKVVITSRPNYFENGLDHLMAVDGVSAIHTADAEFFADEQVKNSELSEKFDSSTVSYLRDLTPEQREALFSIVLKDKPEARQRLIDLFRRFQQLDGLSQRAVIARLLTVVAETLSVGEATTIEGLPVSADELASFSQSTMFKVIINSLLRRDAGIGGISAPDRLRFLSSLAVYLQRSGGDPFASRSEISLIVADIFKARIAHSDTPTQEAENLYRSCRRHSGLTTEGQFMDTAGSVGIGADFSDLNARVGFSHNILREFLVSDAVFTYVVTGQAASGLQNIAISGAICDFIFDEIKKDASLTQTFAARYINETASSLRERLFRIAHELARKHSVRLTSLLGESPLIAECDIGGLSFRDIDLGKCTFRHCLIQDTDFTGANLASAKFENCIIEGGKFDDAKVEGCDFRESELISLYVYDEFNTRTTAYLSEAESRQWLFSRKALVKGTSELNQFLGKPWYQAAKEVAHTVVQKFPGTFVETALYNGTKLKYRDLAKEFVRHLIKRDMLEVVQRSNRDGHLILRATTASIAEIDAFDKGGAMGPNLKPFFEKELSKPQ